MGNQIIIIKNSNTWIEGNAVQQLETTAKLPHMQRVAGMLDLHAGRGYPIGAAFFSTGHFYPALIGNDIGCGMAFWQTDLAAHKAKISKLVKQLGSIYAPLGEDWQARINELLPQHPFQAALGTIGGGNHFAELQVVGTVYAPDNACNCWYTAVRAAWGSIFCAAMWTNSATQGCLKTRPKPPPTLPNTITRWRLPATTAA